MAIQTEVSAAPVRMAALPAKLCSRVGRQVLFPLTFAVLAALGWEILCRTMRISPLLLPPASVVWDVLSENWQILAQQAVPTTLETIISFAVATVCGVVLAFAITYTAWVREASYLHLVMFQVIPKLARAAVYRLARCRQQPFLRDLRHLHRVVSRRRIDRDAACHAKLEILQLCRVTDSERMAGLSHGAVSLRDAVRLCGYEGRGDNGDDRCHSRRVRHRPGRARLHHHVRFLGRRDRNGIGAIVMLCGIGLVLLGIVALAELAMQRWYGGEMPVGGVT